MGEEDFKPLKADDMREVITKLPGADVPPKEKEEVKEYVEKKARKFGVETQDYHPQEIAKDDEYQDEEGYSDEASDSPANPEPKVNPTPSNQEPVSNDATSKGQTAADKSKRDSMKEVPKVSRGVQPTKPKQSVARKVFVTDEAALAEQKAKAKEMKAKKKETPKTEPQAEEKVEAPKEEAKPEVKEVPKETVKPKRVKKPVEETPKEEVKETSKVDLGKKPLTDEEIAEAAKKRKEGLKPFKPDHKPFKAEEKIAESVEESKPTDEERAERAEKKTEKAKTIKEVNRRQKVKTAEEGMRAVFDEENPLKAEEKEAPKEEEKPEESKPIVREKKSQGIQNMNPRSPSSSKRAAPPETEQAKRFKEESKAKIAEEKKPIQEKMEEANGQMKQLKQSIKDAEAIVAKYPDNKIFANDLEEAKQQLDILENEVSGYKESLSAIDKKWADKYADVANAMGPTTVERAKQDMMVDANGKVIGSGRVPVKESEEGFKTRSEEEAEEKADAELNAEEPIKPGLFVHDDFLDKPNHYAGKTVKGILGEFRDRSQWVTGTGANQKIKPKIAEAANLVMANMNAKDPEAKEGDDVYTTLGQTFQEDFGGKTGTLYAFNIDPMGRRSGRSKVLTANSAKDFRLQLLTQLVNGKIPTNEKDGENMKLFEFKLSEGTVGQEASRTKIEEGKGGEAQAKQYEERKDSIEVEDKDTKERDTPKGFREKLTNMTKRVGGNQDGTDRQTIASIVGAVAKGAYQEAEATLVEYLNAKGLMHGTKDSKLIDSSPELRDLFRFVRKMPDIEGAAEKKIAMEDAEDSHKARSEREAKGQAQAFGANVIAPLYMKSLIEASPKELEALKLGKPEIYSSLMRQVDKAEAKVKREYETFKSKGMIDAQTASEIDKMPEGEEKRDAIVTALIDGVNEWLGGRVREDDPKGLDLKDIRTKAEDIAGGKLANVESFFNEKGELQMPELLVAGARKAHRHAKVGYAPKVEMVRGQMTDPAKGIRETREETDEREAEEKEKEVKAKERTDEGLKAGKYTKPEVRYDQIRERAGAKADQILQSYDGPLPVGRKDPKENKEFVRNMVMAYLMRGDDPKEIGDYLKDMAEHHKDVETADVVDEGGYVNVEDEIKNNSLDTTGISIKRDDGKKSKKDKSVDWSGKGKNQEGPYDESTKKMIAAKKKAGKEKAEKKGLKKAIDGIRKWVKPRRWA